MSDVLTFTLHGALVSNNRVARRFGHRTVKSAEAVRDHARVYQLSWAQAQRIGWAMPQAATLEIIAWNTRKDVGNIEKAIADGMIGAAYADDSVLTRLVVEKRLDLDGERYDITIRVAEPLARPKPPRRLRYEDLDAMQRRALATGIIPKGAWPTFRMTGRDGREILPVDAIPASWIARAKKERAAAEVA